MAYSGPITNYLWILCVSRADWEAAAMLPGVCVLVPECVWVVFRPVCAQCAVAGRDTGQEVAISG